MSGDKRPVRAWTTHSVIVDRWTKHSGNLSTAMRAFAYSFIVASALRAKENGTFQFGTIQFAPTVLAACSWLVIIFVVLDVFQYAWAGSVLRYWDIVTRERYCKYSGPLNEMYKRECDSTELVFEEPEWVGLFATMPQNAAFVGKVIVGFALIVTLLIGALTAS